MSNTKPIKRKPDVNSIVYPKSTLSRISNLDSRLLKWMLGPDKIKTFSDSLLTTLREELDEHRRALMVQKRCGHYSGKIDSTTVVGWTLNNFICRFSPWNMGKDPSIEISVRENAFIEAGVSMELITLMRSLPSIGISSSTDEDNRLRGRLIPPFLARYEIESYTLPYNYDFYYRAYAILRKAGYSHTELTD